MVASTVHNPVRGWSAGECIPEGDRRRRRRRHRHFLAYDTRSRIGWPRKAAGNAEFDGDISFGKAQPEIAIDDLFYGWRWWTWSLSLDDGKS